MDATTNTAPALPTVGETFKLTMPTVRSTPSPVDAIAAIFAQASVDLLALAHDVDDPRIARDILRLESKLVRMGARERMALRAYPSASVAPEPAPVCGEVAPAPAPVLVSITFADAATCAACATDLRARTFAVATDITGRNLVAKVPAHFVGTDPTEVAAAHGTVLEVHRSEVTPAPAPVSVEVEPVIIEPEPVFSGTIDALTKLGLDPAWRPAAPAEVEPVAAPAPAAPVDVPTSGCERTTVARLKAGDRVSFDPIGKATVRPVEVVELERIAPTRRRERTRTALKLADGTERTAGASTAVWRVLSADAPAPSAFKAFEGVYPSDLTAAELRRRLRQAGVVAPSKLRKDELVTLALTVKYEGI